jgi:diguanylate cyclase (GGDEF)-like protein
MPEHDHEDVSSLSRFRDRMLGKLASLLEGHVRNWNFGEEMGTFVARENAEFDAAMSHLERHPQDAAGGREALAVAHRCRDVRAAMALLVRERQRQWRHNGDELRDLILELNRLVDELEDTLIDKDLLERQSQVLRNIILSHERISQWKDFVQEILADFHKFFPFRMFFIAFAEEHGLSLYIYYMGSFDEAAHRTARQRLAQEMLARLGLPQDSLLEIEEFQVFEQAVPAHINGVDLLTVSVPQTLPGLEGVLGVGYAPMEGMGAREREIVRSILAVMVMVVGSSKALSRTMAELEYHSVHDPLTGLHNRRYFNEMLAHELARSVRHQHEFAILSLDLDNFKDINDSFGHARGDEVLKELAEELRRQVRKGDILARLGGDEFAVLLAETGKDGAFEVAEHMRQAVREVVFHGPRGEPFHVTLSIGVVCFPTDADSEEDLMAGVDMALYRSKEQGRDTVSSAESIAHNLQRSRLVRANVERLRTALREERLFPYYHRIVKTSDGSLHAHEALARLREPDGEIVPAGTFIETLERYGMGWELDRLMVRRALAAVRDHAQATGESGTRIFINLSAQEIQGKGLLNHAEETCRALALPPERVVFEIVERDAISDMTNMRRFLSDLREKGFSFALDDFGSGYNSFHYLRELHFDYVKIDGAFVRNILHSRTDYALVKNLTRLCQDLGIRTIAEFVESAEILDSVREMGVDYAQGYHLGMPRPALD